MIKRPYRFVLAKRLIKTTDFGIVHDGNMDPESLTGQTNNQVAAKAMRDFLATLPPSQRQVVSDIPAGTQGIWCIANHITMPDDTRIDGPGAVKSISTSSNGQDRAPIWLGYYHPGTYGHRPLNDTNPFQRYVNRYRTNDVVTKNSQQCDIADADAANLSLDGIYQQHTNESAIENSTGVEYDQPYQNGSNRLIDKSSIGGGLTRLTWQYTFGFDSLTPIWITKIIPGQLGSNNAELFWCQRSKINIPVISRTAAYSNSVGGSFECTAEIPWAITYYGTRSGGAHCNIQIENWQGRGFGVELKHTTHEQYVRLQGTIDNHLSEVNAVVGYGEHARNCLADVDIAVKPGFVNPLVTWQFSEDMDVKGSIRCPTLTISHPLQVFADDKFPVIRPKASGLSIEHADSIALITNANLPFRSSGAVMDIKSRSYYTGGNVKYAAKINGGTTGYDITLDANEGKADFASGTSGNVVRGPVGVVPATGAGLASNTDLTTLFVNYEIAAWGDSLTQSFGSSGTAKRWTNILGVALGRAVYMGGVSGETSTQIKTRFLASSIARNIPIIWAGRNNVPSAPANVEPDIAAMVAVCGPKYLVMGIINRNDISQEWSGGSNYNSIVAINAALASTYGTKYVDIREQLVSLFNSGIPQDVIDHGHDSPPSSLTNGSPHLNDAGYAAVAAYVQAKIGSLGW